jgi:hypothetical protein
MSARQTAPGPWRYQEESDAYTHIVRDADGKYVCGCSQNSNGDAEATARLIAATPDLLGALHFVKDFLSDLENGTPPDDPLRELREQLHEKIDAAIAKAEAQS